MNQSCPLCSHEAPQYLCEAHHRPYYLCQECRLVFVPKRFHLSPGDEKAIYDQHENSPKDQGYRHFLSRLLNPLREHIPDNAKGLDFGSGPGPTLSVMLEELGYDMTLYDIYYANNPDVLERTYDFITCTEVVEHLANPKSIFEKLFNLVGKSGVIGIMTKLMPPLEDFASWHYIKDPTHITFYSEETCHHIAAQFGYTAKIARNDVILFLPE